MRLEIATEDLLRKIYKRDIETSFPAAERRPLSSLEAEYERGIYRPYCFIDELGEEVGSAFLLLGHKGWALLDYLCVKHSHRNCGLGHRILGLLEQKEKDTVIFCETEKPESSANRKMALRRREFYLRNNYRLASYEAAIFGVRYNVLYSAGTQIEENALISEHQYVYQNTTCSENYKKHFIIPADSALKLEPALCWEK